MPKTLWGMYDGEPFMENPQLGILSLGNRPKIKRKGVRMAKRRKRTVITRRRKAAAPRVHRRKSSSRRRRSKNWLVSGSVVPVNPRRRRRSSRRRNPTVKSRKRRRHRNPFGIPIKSIVFAGIGFAGPSFVSGFLSSQFPSVMQSTTNLGVMGKYVVKIGSILGLSWLAKRFAGSSEAQMVLIGGGANIALSLIQDFQPGLLPANPLGTYIPTQAPMMTKGGMSGYVPMRSYIPLRGMGHGMGASPRIGTAALMPRQPGAITGTASRFKRF
jgi:hypothetical protein